MSTAAGSVRFAVLIERKLYAQRQVKDLVFSKRIRRVHPKFGSDCGLVRTYMRNFPHLQLLKLQELRC